jgi:multiple sugar transport system ATP-binding protein
MAILQLSGISKVFPGGVEVVKAVDLEVEAGELVTFVGPSGSGKSTLLHLIAGFETPTTGSIVIDGERVDERAPGERRLAMVFQSYALYPTMTVAANIGFPLEMAGVARAERDRRVGEMAEELGLAGLLARKPKELSGGQRQRVALARALVRRPRLCLFDEPLSNLDASLRGQTRALIKRLHESSGATFLYVTHDQTEAMTMSDRIVVLGQGRVQQVAPPREVYDRPANRFVAEFMGEPGINWLPRDAAEAVDLGVRPEHLVLAREPPLDEAHVLVGTITAIEPTGADTFVTVTLAESARSVAIVARLPADADLRRGERVFASFASSRLLRFDRASGRLLD